MRLLISTRQLFPCWGVFSFFAGLLAQSSLNNQVDQLLLRLDALEGVEANEDGRGTRESSNQAVVSPEFKDQIDQNKISVEEKIDQLLKRLEDLEDKDLSIINEPRIETADSLDGMMDPPEPLPQGLNFDEIVSDQAEFDTISPISGVQNSSSSMPSEFSEKFDSIDMDTRINELLDRLDILEENSAANTNSSDDHDEQIGERFPDNKSETAPIDFNEFPGGNNQQGDPGEMTENSTELNKVLSPDRHNRFGSPPNKTPPVNPSEKSVGSRVDELLKRLDSLEDSWSDDGIDASLYEPQSQSQPNDLSIESASAKEAVSIVQDNAAPAAGNHIEIQTDGLSGQSMVSEEGLVPFPDRQSSGTTVEKLSNEKFDNRLDELLSRLKKLESIKQQQENRSQRSSNVDLSVKESPPNLNFKKPSNEKPKPHVALPEAVPSKDLQKRKKTSNFQQLSESNKLETNQPHGWDLLILRELVLQNAPELAIKKAQVSTTQQSIPALEFGNYPNVKGKVSYNDYTKIASFQTWDSEPYGIFSYGVEGRWVLYDGHKTRKQIRTAELETEEAQWSLVVEEQKALRQLIEHFFNALNSQIELYFLRGIDRLIRERLVIYEKQVKSGIQDRMLLNKTIRELENLRSQKLIAEHSIQSSKSEISFLINADDQFWQSGKRFLSPPEFFLDYEFDPSSSAQVSLGKSAVKVAESKYDEIKSGMSPVFELTSNAGYKGKNKIGLDTQGQELSIGLSLTLPITDYYLTKSKLLKAREEIKQAEAKEYNLLRQQQNQYRSELLKLELAEKDYLLQKELWDLQKNRLEDMNFVSGRGLFDKSSALLEEEELLRRELSREQAKMKTIRHKYQLDLIE